MHRRENVRGLGQGQGERQGERQASDSGWPTVQTGTGRHHTAHAESTILSSAALASAPVVVHPAPAATTPVLTPVLTTIHFVYLGLWGGATPPAAFQRNLDHWRAANPSSVVRLWSNAEVIALIDTHFEPSYLAAYHAAAPISKVRKGEVL